jgi:hypothetical protein
MNLLSWLDFTAGPPWTWRHYLFVSVLVLAVGAALVFVAQRRGKREAGTVRHFKSSRRRGAP